MTNIAKGGSIFMAISPVARVSAVTSTPAIQPTNSNHKSIETELTAKQQNLKKVSSDTTITATEREQKRRELQKEIDELNRKLRQEKLEQKEKEAEAAKKEQMEAARKMELNQKNNTAAKAIDDSSKTASAEKDKTNTEQTDKISEISKENVEKAKTENMSVKDIQQMLSAEFVMQKERVQEQVDLQIEGTINVLESEIRQDKIYNTDTSHKEAEVKALHEKENFWSNAQMQMQQAQTQMQANNPNQTLLNTNAKTVTDQI